LQAAPSPAEFVVRRDLAAIVGRALDLAALFGTGVDGQPAGLAGLTGVNTFSGTSASLTSLVDAAVALGDGLNASAGVATTKTIAGLLRTRPESTGSAFTLWMGSLIAGTCIGMPARSSSQITAGSLFIGSWDYLNVVVWGDGIEISANPYATGNFQAGIVGVRAFLTCDVQPTFASAFNYASAIT
jgi:HK97 family phage major capsid protein